MSNFRDLLKCSIQIATCSYFLYSSISFLRSVRAKIRSSFPDSSRDHTKSRCTRARARVSAPSWKALHSHTCAHKYSKYLQLVRGTQPEAVRDGRYVVTMKGVAFEDQKLSPVRFILPLAVARCREWRTFLAAALRLLLTTLQVSS